MDRLTIRKSDFALPIRGSDAVSVLQCVDRLADIEDILGDDYDLDRLKVLVNQCMTMREEVSERFSITKNIPVDQLRNLVAQAPYWMCPVCVGCKGKTKDGKRTEFCKYPEDMKLCEESQKKLLELAEADRDGRCVVLPKDGMIYYIEESDGERWIGNKPIQDIVFLYGWGLASLKCSISEIGKTKHFSRESAEAALKGDQENEKT